MARRAAAVLERRMGLSFYVAVFTRLAQGQRGAQSSFLLGGSYLYPVLQAQRAERLSFYVRG
jgi:hypothetical protein